jgi:hypothetical protein
MSVNVPAGYQLSHFSDIKNPAEAGFFTKQMD